MCAMAWVRPRRVGWTSKGVRMDLVLYTNPMSRGRIARWMLEETGTPYATVVLEYGAAMKAPDYLAINPMGKVPAIRHGTRVVTENAAICAYLADAFPQAGLGPSQCDRADYYRWLFFAAGPLEQAMTLRAADMVPAADQARMFGFGTYEDVVTTLEAWLRDRDFVCGAQFTAADVFLGAQVTWGLRMGTLEARPAFDTYAARLAARPAAIRAAEQDDALARDLS